MKVKCKWCGAENEKKEDEYKVKCKVCGKTTYYIVVR